MLNFSLSQAVDQAVKIIIAIELNFDFTSLAMFFDYDLGTEVAGKILGEAGKVYLFGFICRYPGGFFLRF